MDYPHPYFLACRFPKLDNWCIRRNGEPRALCGFEVTANVAGVTETLIGFDGVCPVCKSKYRAETVFAAIAGCIAA